jgi:SAM-dependent methyltransferase
MLKLFCWFFLLLLLVRDSNLLKLHGLIRRDKVCSSLFAQSQDWIDDAKAQELVTRRTQYRQKKQFIEADLIRNRLLEAGVVVMDQMGWNTDWKRLTNTYNESVIENGRDFMRMANLASETLSMNESEVNRAKVLLQQQRYGAFAGGSNCSISSSEMQGRKFADAAFSMSMAGVQDNELFNLLANCTLTELKRFGHRSSCKRVHILQILEKLAVAGVRNLEFYESACDIIRQKNESGSIVNTSSASFSLSSNRALLWLWRQASKHSKLGLQAQHPDGASLPENISQAFSSPQLPLVLDLGCGYGASLLALAAAAADGNSCARMNFLGVDMNPRSLSYARGITARWGLQGSCCFLEADSDAALERVAETYLGPLALAMVSFPTPFASTLRPGARGNAQLPGVAQFMLRPALLQKLRRVLRRRHWALPRGAAPALYIQSNVEEVAVAMKEMVGASGAEGVPGRRWRVASLPEMKRNLQRIFAVSSDPSWQRCATQTLEALQQQDPSLRDRRWRTLHKRSAECRAAGPSFLSRSPLPFGAKSETEAACEVQGRPIHRMMFLFK